VKPTFKLPKTGRGWFGLTLVVVDLLIGCAPVILLFNDNSIVLGMPLMMTWSIGIIFFTSLTLLFLNKMEGVK